jgi:hypothetical protein
VLLLLYLQGSLFAKEEIKKYQPPGCGFSGMPLLGGQL